MYQILSDLVKSPEKKERTIITVIISGPHIRPIYAVEYRMEEVEELGGNKYLEIETYAMGPRGKRIMIDQKKYYNLANAKLDFISRVIRYIDRSSFLGGGKITILVRDRALADTGKILYDLAKILIDGKPIVRVFGPPVDVKLFEIY